MKFVRSLFIGLALFVQIHLSAQADTLVLSLTDIIELTQSDAPDVQIAKTSFINNFWNYQSVLADYKPQIGFEATIPDLNRTIDRIILPDGTEKFINRSLMNNSVGLNLSQDIPATGGSVNAGIGLSRLDIFETDQVDGSVSYLFSPIQIGLIQPLFQFNEFKWNKKLAPVIFEEAQKGYSANMEAAAFEAATFFFDVLLAQLSLQAANRDKMNADTLYAISKGRYEVGRIAETELLQIELSVMDAEADLASSILDLQTSTEQLRNFLGIKRVIQFKLIPPDEIPEFYIDEAKALDYAHQNRSEMVTYERRLLEAEREVERAEKNAGVNVDLIMGFGLSRDAEMLNDVTSDFLDNERLTLGINVPIADWGKTRARTERAISNQNLTRLLIDQERVNFDREVLIKVQQFDLVRKQVRLANRTYEVAQKRLTITRERYRIGNILVTDLNLAIREEANARRGYISALRSFWLAYYDLRQLTLYDFMNDRPLVKGTGNLVK